MRKFSAIVFILLSINSIAQQKEQYFRFVENNKNVINKIITRTISIDRINSDTVYAYANNAELEQFQKLGYKIEMLTAPSLLPTKVLNMATDISQMLAWDRYPTYEVYREMMKKFESDYPTLCKLDSIGTTVEGRKLYVVKISDNVSTNEAEPEFFYTSTMHGDEVTGYVLMLRLADYLLSMYNTDPRITAMVDNMAIYINPNANPDGTYNTNNSTVSGSTRYNGNNVDINRNFPDPRAGDHPDGYSWQPETKAMMDFAGQHRFVMAANFHGGIELANYPWDTWTSAQNPHPDNSWFYTISRAYADTVHKYSPTDYFTGQSNGVTHGGDWYVVAGGRQDYMNYWHQCREITLEISDTKILSTDLLPSYWNYNKASMLNYIELALTGFNGTVKNPLGEPLDATITVLNHDKDSSFVKTNKTFGNYYRPIAPGNYSIQYSSKGYIDQTHNINIENYTTSVTKDIVLQNAAQVDLYGTITEKSTGTPIEGVKVEIIGTDYAPVYSNASGNFTVNSVYEHQYQIKVSKTGYKQQTTTFDLTSSNNILNFSLEINYAESFENGIPEGITFSNGSWTIDNNTAFDGTYSLKSASIGNSQQTSITLSLNLVESGEISFARKVSSESNYDFLKFYIDGVEKGSWSGEIAWSEVSYAVTSGSHTFLWKYIKDGAYTSGNDCAWIDNISPPVNSQKVLFTISVNGSVQEGLTVEFNNQTFITDTEGKASFTGVLKGKNQEYSVSVQNAKLNEGIVDVYWTDITKSINIINNSTVNLEIKSNGNPVNGASVNLNQTQQTTNNLGIANFTNVPFGLNRSYTVTMNGYENAQGQIQVYKDSTYSIPIYPTGIEKPTNTIETFTINPNPFRDRTTITCNLKKSSKIDISVFDVTGQLVINVFNGELIAGEYRWEWSHTETFLTNSKNSIFIVRLIYNGNTVSKKIVQIN